MKYFRTIVISVVMVIGLAIAASLVLGTPAALADNSSKGQICQGIGVAGGNCTNGSGQAGVTGLVQTIVNLMSWIVGIIAVIMVIIAGLKYITAGGSSEKLSSAKSTLIYALIGIAIVALAQFLISFTYHAATTGSFR